MPWQAVTLAQCQTQLKAKWENVPFWTDAEATAALNEGLRVWNMLTGMWRQRVVVATPAASPWVSLSSTMVYGTKINFITSPLIPSSRDDLDLFRPGWEGETTASGGAVPTTPKLWAPAGLNLFAIWPADAAGGQSLTVDGVRKTPVLVNPGDFIDIGEHELDALLGFALHVASFKLGSPLFNGTAGLRKNFLLAAVDQNTRLMASSYFRRQLGLDVSRYSRPFRSPDPLDQAKAAPPAQAQQAGGSQ